MCESKGTPYPFTRPAVWTPEKKLKASFLTTQTDTLCILEPPWRPAVSGLLIGPEVDFASGLQDIIWKPIGMEGPT